MDVHITTNQKKIEIVAGPNGSGKTTFAESYFLRTQEHSVFLNPDLIASGIAPLEFEKASFLAGRILISEIKSRLNKKESFSYESTLSGKTWAPFLRKAIDEGYQITIYFLFLKSVQQNIARVKKRVKMGGHPIPRASIIRRHPRCFLNFWTLYRPLCDNWFIFDNSGAKPKQIQSKIEFECLSREKQKRFATHFLSGKI
jgi:predicted ABC-type ATPase